MFVSLQLVYAMLLAMVVVHRQAVMEVVVVLLLPVVDMVDPLPVAMNLVQ